MAPDRVWNCPFSLNPKFITKYSGVSFLWVPLYLCTGEHDTNWHAPPPQMPEWLACKYEEWATSFVFDRSIFVQGGIKHVCPSVCTYWVRAPPSTTPRLWNQPEGMVNDSLQTFYEARGMGVWIHPTTVKILFGDQCSRLSSSCMISHWKIHWRIFSWILFALRIRNSQTVYFCVWNLSQFW